MGSLTPKLGLYMPADDGSEPINVATDLNDNLEKIDSNIGFVPSTSVTPPAIVYDGAATYETDTGRAKFRKGLAWNYLLSAGATFLSNVSLDAAYRFAIGTATPGALFDMLVTSITSVPILRARQSNEAQPRMQLDHDGIRFGGGSVTPETRIYRSASNQLSVVGNVSVGSSLSVTGTSTMGATSMASADVDGTLVVDGVATFNTTAKQNNMNILTGLSGTVNVNISASTSGSANVVFSQAFSSAPVVFVNIGSAPGASSGWIVRAINVTTTGFTAFATGASNTWTANVQWVAIGA